MGIKLSSEPFITQAMETTGLEDFGGRTFEAGMEALIHSLNHDIDLNEGNAGYFQQVIVQVLTNRLAVTQLIKEHPEISAEKIEAPLIVVGLPRSGTTFLQTLLAMDPLARYLRNFETFSSLCPPPELFPVSVDPRIQTCDNIMEGFFKMAPTLRGINGINFMAHGTAECQNLTALEFVHMGWSAGSSLFSHGNWVGECDMGPAYQWHQRLLQMLQWKLPNERWVLKAPMHLFGLDCLLETYPDARIVFTHRDPVAAMASGVSMVRHWTEFTTQQVDLPAIADWYPKLWAKGLERALALRKKAKKGQIFDVYHQALIQDPMHTIQKIYDHFDLPFGQGAEKRMQTWLRDNPRSRFGTHSVSTEVLGLNPGQEKERFGFYLAQFDL